MLKERLLGVSTTLPSRASHAMAHSKMGPVPSLPMERFRSRSSRSVEGTRKRENLSLPFRLRPTRPEALVGKIAGDSKS